MFSLESLPGLFTRLSLTTHRNFAKVLAFAVPISHSVVWHALSRLHTVLFSAGRFATSKVRLLPQQPVALGLLAVLSILIVIAPTSVQALKGKWSPVSLSAPQSPARLQRNIRPQADRDYPGPRWFTQKDLSLSGVGPDIHRTGVHSYYTDSPLQESGRYPPRLVPLSFPASGPSSSSLHYRFRIGSPLRNHIEGKGYSCTFLSKK